jgi:hypothetical protein
MAIAALGSFQTPHMTAVTADIPASGTPPAACVSIDFSSNAIFVAIHGYVGGTCWVAFASTAAGLLTKLSTASTDKQKLVAGYFEIPVSQFEGFVGFISDGGAITNGLSYHLIKG